MPVLFEPSRHESLAGAAWDERVARDAIERIVEDTLARGTPHTLWPVHPLDNEHGDSRAPITGLDIGAAGVVWALDRLARAGATRQRIDLRAGLEDLAARNVAQVRPLGYGVESYLIGRAGVLLTQFRVAPDPAVADHLASSIAANADHPSRELQWGAPGTMHAAVEMYERTGETRWRDLFRASAAALAASLTAISGTQWSMWTQDLYGQKVHYLGAGHGFVGNAGALARGSALLEPDEWQWWREHIVATVTANIVRDGSRANWPGWYAPTGNRRFFVQWCHGAPGFVVALATIDDVRLDPILDAAGELIWAAGPLVKGAGLCHGTAGNGYAFLKMYARTGDKRWLERARAFAMHAIAQSDAHAAQYGMRRHSLWTGDPGLALYLWSCITATAAWPTLDPDGPA
jgi:hypothetical protein